jgi:hypothetical protein
MDNRTFFGGLAFGAALMFALDPDRGGRRRALVRDKLARGRRMTGEALDATMTDMRQRAQGVVAATRSRFADEAVEDVRLVERVRAKLGRACSHPHAIAVEACDGEITLRGPILAEEVNPLLATVSAVRGVDSVISELEAHESSEGVPSLQGRGRTAGPSLDLLQSNWAPATRALVAAAAVAAGGAAVAYARR